VPVSFDVRPQGVGGVEASGFRRDPLIMSNTYIIRASDPDDDLAFHISDWASAFRPSSAPSEVISGWGNLRLRILGTEVSLADEAPGVQVDFDSEGLSQEQERAIIREMGESAERYSGIPVEVVEW
jgi:hypothetical protein